MPCSAIWPLSRPHSIDCTACPAHTAVPQTYFPTLKSLSLDAAPLVSLDFTTATTPALQSLSMEQISAWPLAGFTLELPHLTHLSFNFVTVR